MAKKQTRRTISFSRAVYDTVMQAAGADGMSAAEWITQLVRERVPGLPEGVHVRKDGSLILPKATLEQQRLHATPRAVAVMPSIPPRRVTKQDIAIAEIQRRAAGVPTGALCANCVDYKATHMGRVDREGPLYPLCDMCELPKEGVA